MSVILYPDTEKYLGNFYIPEMSSYEFLKCFFAALYLHKKKEITREITDFFYEIKGNERYSKLLEEITFKSNGVFWYSHELEDDILMLQNVGLLGKRNPSFGKILIDYDDQITKNIRDSVCKQTWELIDEVAQKFIENENTKKEL